MDNDRFAKGGSFFRTLRDLGSVTIDAGTIEEAINFGRAFPSPIEPFSQLGSDVIIDGKQEANFQRILAGWVLMAGLSGRSASSSATRVSTEPPSSAALRRSIRLLSMVSELHKAGYQHLRIAAGMNPAGTHWRCYITHTANIEMNGWEPRNWEADVARYSAGDEDRYFGWADATGKNARQLACLFIDRFPVLAQKGLGRDRLYVGWFHEMLGSAENGRLPIFFADYPLTPNSDEMPPPPPSGILVSLVERADRSSENDAQLRWRELPPPNASWEQISAFALTYDGYKGGARSIDECATIYDEVVRHELSRATSDELLTCLFFMQRRTKWNSQMDPGEVIDICLARRIVEALRNRTGGAQE